MNGSGTETVNKRCPESCHVLVLLGLLAQRDASCTVYPTADKSAPHTERVHTHAHAEQRSYLLAQNLFDNIPVAVTENVSWNSTMSQHRQHILGILAQAQNMLMTLGDQRDSSDLDIGLHEDRMEGLGQGLGVLL